jgi:hypothetical protein
MNCSPSGNSIALFNLYGNAGSKILSFIGYIKPIKNLNLMVDSKSHSVLKRENSIAYNPGLLAIIPLQTSPSCPPLRALFNKTGCVIRDTSTDPHTYKLNRGYNRANATTHLCWKGEASWQKSLYNKSNRVFKFKFETNDILANFYYITNTNKLNRLIYLYNSLYILYCFTEIKKKFLINTKKQTRYLFILPALRPLYLGLSRVGARYGTYNPYSLLTRSIRAKYEPPNKLNRGLVKQILNVSAKADTTLHPAFTRSQHLKTKRALITPIARLMRGSIREATRQRRASQKFTRQAENLNLYKYEGPKTYKLNTYLNLSNIKFKFCNNIFKICVAHFNLWLKIYLKKAQHLTKIFKNINLNRDLKNKKEFFIRIINLKIYKILKYFCGFFSQFKFLIKHYLFKLVFFKRFISHLKKQNLNFVITRSMRAHLKFQIFNFENLLTFLKSSLFLSITRNQQILNKFKVVGANTSFACVVCSVTRSMKSTGRACATRAFLPEGRGRRGTFKLNGRTNIKRSSCKGLLQVKHLISYKSKQNFKSLIKKLKTKQNFLFIKFASYLKKFLDKVLWKWAKKQQKQVSYHYILTKYWIFLPKYKFNKHLFNFKISKKVHLNLHLKKNQH